MTEPARSPARPAPLASLVASARRLTSKTMTRAGSTAKSWQEDAWEMYDLVGEQRFLASTLAGRLSQARLYVGEVGDNPTEQPDPTKNATVISVLDAVGGSAAARGQLVQRLGVNLFVAGDGWMVGIPKRLFPRSLLPGPFQHPSELPELEEPIDPDTLDITDLEWRMLSVSEVSSKAGGEITLMLGEGEGEKIITNPDDIFLIRVWRPHPRRWWEADSPTRSSLPVLRELVGLTMHISAQVDSRLAGAGLLIVPQSAQRALNRAAGLADDDDSDQFTEALMEAMLKPIENRANASALVPLVVTVPDEVTDSFNFITFAKPLDTESRNLRDEAIRRLALGQDAPPELLLGTAGMNHWGAWLVQEDVVTTHLEPPLALICDSLTTQYLWPVLIDQGMDEEEAQKYVIWYDVSDLVVRPNRSQDALTLHERGVISDTALRANTGFDESDMPEAYASLPPETVLALELARQNPSLFANPGLPQLIAQLRAAIQDDIPEVDVTPTTTEDIVVGGENPTPTPGEGEGPPSSAGDGGVSIPETDANPPAVPPAAIAAGAGWPAGPVFVQSSLTEELLAMGGPGAGRR
jgi:hypothetical protein